MPRSPSDIAEQIVDAHLPLGGLAFSFGQGSVFTGFTADSDLDIVMIWDRKEVPGADLRPAHDLTDPQHTPRRHALPGMALDNLRIDDRPVDIAHYPLSTFRSWCRQVHEGGGWQKQEWPLPLHAVAGFTYGVDLADPAGLAASARSDLAVLPKALAIATRAALTETRAGYAADLASAARAGNGWLLHSLLTPVVRTAYYAWFAAEGRYCPFPKHLRAWAERFALNRDIADLDARLWTDADLTSRHRTALELVDRILALPEDGLK